MSKLVELSAIYDSERFRFDNADGDVVIADAKLVNGSAPASADPWITIKGKADLDELKRNHTYRFYGKWTNYTNKRSGITEKQFHFQTFVEAEPHGRAGIVAYLKRAGEGNNIGHATSNKIYDKFGSDAVRVLREEPCKVADAIKRLKPAECEAAAEWLKERQAVENCTIELTNLLDGRGLPKGTARNAIRQWGNEATQVIKNNPYILMSFRGCGFKRCDGLYLDLGLRPDRLLRQALCAWYSIASNNDGHTWFPAQFAINGLSRQINNASLRPAAALKMAKRIGRLSLDANGAIAIQRESGGVVVDEGGNVWVAEGRKAKSETELAECVASAMTTAATCRDTLWPDVLTIPNIDDHQRENLGNALQGRIAILGGGPGTGKTFTGANLIKEVAKVVGYQNIAGAAPTGKAAVRISEVMQAYGVPLQARTWHSLLGVGEQDEASGNWSFSHNKRNPWPFKVIIGDESSMNDTNLMNSIMQALAAGTHLLLLGDVNQLPPVGHGAPLRDMIAAGVPYGELTEIKRNSGGIVEACAAIRQGKSWSEGDNLTVHEVGKPDLQTAVLIEKLAIQKELGLDPVWDCQTLVAVNEKSKLSRKEINKVLQAELNPLPAVKNCPFRVNDKIVNLKNGFFPAIEDSETDEADTNDRDEVYVANGELAKVLEIGDKFYVVEVLSPKRVIRIPRGQKDTGCSWDLGYALSVHKSQGSEWPVVFVMIDEYPGAKMVCSREWIYTAISRAKKQCVLIGKKAVADSMCKRTAIDKRKTFLRELILKKQAEMELVEL